MFLAHLYQTRFAVLVPSSESGFITSDPTTPRLSARTKYGFTTDFVEDDSEDGLSSAIAEMEELVNKVDSADESLKSLFARYLDTNLDASRRLDLLDEIKNHLSSLTLDAENASFEDDYLKIVATAQKIANNTEAAVVTETLVAPEVVIDAVIPPKEAEIAQLAHGLQRVLFNPGIHWLQHPRTGTYNFTKNVQKVADRDEFDFQRLPKFVRPSQDADLRKLLKDSGRKFAGSTSR